MILDMLQLESEFPRADWTTPSQVSTLEPLLRTLLGSPLVPSKQHFPKFPHLGFMCLVHEPENTYFSMKMSWFCVVSGASLVWSWQLWFLDWMSWRRKKLQLAEAFPTFPTFVTSPSALCHFRDDGISACGGRIHPLVDTCLSSDLIRHVGTWWEGAPTV